LFARFDEREVYVDFVEPVEVEVKYGEAAKKRLSSLE